MDTISPRSVLPRANCGYIPPTADEIRIFENGAVIASHLPLEGRDQTRIDPAHRKIAAPPRCRPANGAPIVIRRAGDQVARRSLDFYQAVAQRIAGQRGAP